MTFAELPIPLKNMVKQGLVFVKSPVERAAIKGVVKAIAPAAYERWFARRTPSDNRADHEFIVFVLAMEIAEAENLSPDDKIVVAVFVFIHDCYSIPRITEKMIRDAPPEEQPVLRARKVELRWAHMQLGAERADSFLRELGVVKREIRERAVALAARHDEWKLGVAHPLAADRVAVVALESDALWPLTIGVLADLEREGKNVCDPSEWHSQLANSLQTLLQYRENWKDCTGEGFQDGESIFRTAAGAAIFRRWRAFWRI